MKLSKNFALSEITHSNTAKRLGIDNTPSEKHLANSSPIPLETPVIKTIFLFIMIYFLIKFIVRRAKIVIEFIDFK